MTTRTEISMHGFFRLPYSAHRQSASSLHVFWNRLRRVSRRTNDGTVATVDEPLGSSSAALFDVRMDVALGFNDQIFRSLSSLNFTPAQCHYLSSKITSFTVNFAIRGSGRRFSDILVIADVNFIELHSDDHIHGSVSSHPPRPSPFTYFSDEEFILGLPTDALGGAAADGNRGGSESALKKLRRSKFMRRGGEVDNCSVCLETFFDGEEIISLSCDHFYHGSCIISWLKNHRNCPLCRQEISTTMQTKTLVESCSPSLTAVSDSNRPEKELDFTILFDNLVSPDYMLLLS